MPYRPSYDHGRLWPPIAALLPAAGIAAIFVAISILPVLLAQPLFGTSSQFPPGPASLPDILRFAVMIVVMLLGLAVVGFITVGIWLVMVGVPVAWLIGRHIRHPASLIPAIFAAVLSLWIALGRPSGMTGLTDQPFILALGLWCAGGSAIIYRHFLIRFSDETELVD